MKQLLLDIKPAAPPSFNNFVIGKNAELVFQLKHALNTPQEAHFIYLWGESGSGKTHLIEACRTHPVVLVDNVHLLDNTAQINLFNQYNELKNNNGTLICTGLHAPTQMGLRDDLATRLAWGLVYQCQPLSDQDKTTALKQHAFERGMKLPDEVADYCLRYLRRDLPTLMATLDALDEWSLTMQKPVTVPMLRKLLQLNLDI